MKFYGWINNVFMYFILIWYQLNVENKKKDYNLCFRYIKFCNNLRMPSKLWKRECKHVSISSSERKQKQWNKINPRIVSTASIGRTWYSSPTRGFNDSSNATRILDSRLQARMGDQCFIDIATDAPVPVRLEFQLVVYVERAFRRLPEDLRINVCLS